MLPGQSRTGKAVVRENGFTSHFSIDGENYSFSVKYHGDNWKRFPEHLKKKVAELCCSTWVASVPAQKKIFTHRLDDSDVEVIKYISYQSQGYYRNKMEYPGLEGRPELRITRGETSWDQIELDNDSCGVYFSGGRDAFATLALLEDAGYDPHLQMHNWGSTWETGEKARETFEEEDRDMTTCWNNKKVTERQISKNHNIYWLCEVPTFWLAFFESIPMLEQELMFFGNEATTTRYTSVGKDRILHSSWQQSMITNYLMTEWAEENGINLRVGSLLREMGDYRLTRELLERRPDYWELSRSCFFVDDEDDYSPCSKCHKDYRNWIILQALGHDDPRYDEERLGQYEIDPAKLMWKTLLPNDFSHINYHTDLYPDAPNQERPEVEGLMFKKDRANPSYFLSREEFNRIYQAIMGDDEAWLPTESGRWQSMDSLDAVYETIDDWSVEEQFDYAGKVKKNTSLLNI